MLTAGFPTSDKATSLAAIRRDLEGAVARDSTGRIRPGIFYVNNTPLVTARPDMRLNVGDFRAVQDKQGACFFGNVGTDQTPAFEAAPSANRRIDLLYATQKISTIDGGTTETIFGIVKGTASPTPVAPALPGAVADAIRLATVEIPAGATSMQSAGIIITPVFLFTAMAGGTVVVRNSVELAAWTPADGSTAFNLADTQEYVRRNGTWGASSGQVTLLRGADPIDVPTTGLLIPWASAIEDSAGMFSASAPTMLTARTAGIYRFEVDIYGATNNASGKLAFRVNGASVDSGAVAGATPSSVWPVQLSLVRTMKLSAGDYVEARAIGPVPFTINRALSSFAAIRVR